MPPHGKHTPGAELGTSSGSCVGLASATQTSPRERFSKAKKLFRSLVNPALELLQNSDDSANAFPLLHEISIERSSSCGGVAQQKRFTQSQYSLNQCCIEPESDPQYFWSAWSGIGHIARAAVTYYDTVQPTRYRWSL